MNLKTKDGITLIALAVTIVVMLILAGVTTSVLTGESGIITKAKKAKVQSVKAGIKEIISLENNQFTMEELEGEVVEKDYNEKIDQIWKKIQDEGLTKKGIVVERKKNIVVINNEIVIPLYTLEDAVQADDTLMEMGIRQIDGDRNNDVATIAGYKGTEEKVVIPDYYVKDKKIYPVTIINQPWTGNRFYGNTNIKEIVMNNNIEIIEAWAFGNMTNLESIKLSIQISSIPDGVFNNCKNLKEITIPDKVTTIGNNTFQFCTSLERIEIPSSVKEIGELAFGYVGNNGTTYMGTEYKGKLKQIILNEGLEKIGKEAFTWADTVSYDLTIPTTVTTIGERAFDRFGFDGGGKLYNNK